MADDTPKDALGNPILPAGTKVLVRANRREWVDGELRPLKIDPAKAIVIAHDKDGTVHLESAKRGAYFARKSHRVEVDHGEEA